MTDSERQAALCELVKTLREVNERLRKFLDAVEEK